MPYHAITCRACACIGKPGEGATRTQHRTELGEAKLVGGITRSGARKNHENAAFCGSGYNNFQVKQSINIIQPQLLEAPKAKRPSS
jgi:hypothetical protein